MDEATWLGSDDPAALLAWLGGPHPGGVSGVGGGQPYAFRLTDRKLRLFACACCRLVGSDPAHVDQMEQEGPHAGQDVHPSARITDAQWAENWASREGSAIEPLPDPDVRAALLREIVGNPFRRVVFGPVWPSLPADYIQIDRQWLLWQDCLPVRLAEGIYEDRAFDRLPILADALEEAGCASEGLLGHLRGPGPHCRGCWALDLVLGKN